MTNIVLTVKGLCVDLPHRAGEVRAVDHVGFEVRQGEVLGLVGESGAGKSALASALVGLVPAPGRVTVDEMLLNQGDIDLTDPASMRRCRGKRIGLVLSDPLASLDPLFRIGDHFTETIRAHTAVSRRSARARAAALLDRVGVAGGIDRLDAYPHQLSGGLRQRIALALALAPGPALLIADEPTSALDVSIQHQIVSLLRSLVRDHALSVLLISHDIGVIAEAADRVAVMYAGRIVEIGSVRDVLLTPRHPYTAGLIGSVPRITDDANRLIHIPGAMPRVSARSVGCSFAPRCGGARQRCTTDRPESSTVGKTEVICWIYQGGPDDHRIQTEPDGGRSGERRGTGPERSSMSGALVEVQHVSRVFDQPRPWLAGWIDGPRSLTAVRDVSLAIARHETLALIGESGSGKSTLAKMVAGLLAPSAGEVLFDGHPVLERRRNVRDPRSNGRLQMVFQDPASSLDPQWRVRDIVAEPIRAVAPAAPRGRVHAEVHDLLERVGLAESDGSKYPRQLSGGQRQRVAIARAIATKPDFVVCDEPTSALDVSVQAQVLNLLRDLQDDDGLAYLLISHNLAVVRYMAHRIGVMYLGSLVELGPADRVLTDPRHPYTRMLLDAVPDVALSGRQRGPVRGEVPDPMHPPIGCTFHPRCPLVIDRCLSEIPQSRPLGERLVACHRA